MDDITLASLDGHVASMRELLTTNLRSSSPPPASEEPTEPSIQAGSEAGALRWPAMPAPDALESLLNNPGTQCTLFPFLGQLGDAPVACWDLWYNTLFVHDVNTQDESGAYGEGSK